MSMEEVVANLVQKVERRFYGKYRGFVKDNDDPEKLGRLKVTVPSVLGKEVVTGWAFPCVPYGGSSNQGFLFIPEKEAGVWIEFEEGDPEFPIWVGTFWSKPSGESELPKPNKADGSEEGAIQTPPSSKIIKTKKGHTIQLEDADGKEMITIVEAKNNHVITLDKNGIKIIDGANGHDITMKKDAFDMNANTSFTITQGDNIMKKDDNGISITDKNGNTLTMDSAGAIVTDKNNNKITMAAAGITIEDKTKNKVDLSASGITVKAMVGVSIETVPPVGKIDVGPAGVTLGMGMGGPVACVGTNMVPTMIGPQPILPGPNMTTKA